MGVKGLWKLLDPAAKPVALESLSGKILAVDVSIWLNKAAKGMRDSFGNPVYNAHLLLIFHRICKLLFYNIKPIFVFDGGVPELKKKTLAARREAKFSAERKSKKVSEKLLKNYLKSKAMRTVTGSGKIVKWKQPAREEDLFALPDQPAPKEAKNSSPSESEEEEHPQDAWMQQLECNSIVDMMQDTDQIDITSPSFSALPPEVQHELLVEMKDSHRHRHYKQTAAPMPEESKEFSSFQLSNLLKRGRITRKIDEVRQTMNSQFSGEIVEQYSTTGADRVQHVESRRIASDDKQHYILIKSSAKKSSNALFEAEIDDHIKEIQDSVSVHPSFQRLERTPAKFKESSLMNVLESVLLSESSSDETDEERVTSTDGLDGTSTVVSSAEDESAASTSNAHESKDITFIGEDKSALLEDASFKPCNVPITSLKSSIKYLKIINIKSQNASETIDLEAIPESPVDRITVDKKEEEPTIEALAPKLAPPLKELVDKEIREIDPPGGIAVEEPQSSGSVTSTSFAHVPCESPVEHDEELKEFINKVAGSSKDDFPELQQDLEIERNFLEMDKQKTTREAASISNEMYKDVQALLALFGVPFIISPQEAEAQCAVLDEMDLTHGSITDDSDIFLFGARRVYRNIFNTDKYAECYDAKEIESLLHLDRRALIAVAMLTGSDYTEGIQGVGGVTAVEILHEFGGDPIEALVELKKWCDSCKTKAIPAAETKLKSKLRKIELPSSFPSQHVIEAYVQPLVDTSDEPCEWAKPDLDSLRIFANEKFGWRTSKADEILLPVMSRLNRPTNTIDRFMTVNLKKPVKSYSKRLQRVLTAQKFVQNNPESSAGGASASKKRRTDPPATSTQPFRPVRSEMKNLSRKRQRGKKTQIGLNRSHVAIAPKSTLKLSESSSESE